MSDERRLREPDPALAAFLNVVLPGSGYWYVGSPILGIIVLVLLFALVKFWVASACRDGTAAFHTSSLIALAMLVVLLPTHAWWIASRRTPAAPRWFEHWFAILLTCAVTAATLLSMRVYAFSSVKTYRISGRNMSTTLLDGESIIGCPIADAELTRRRVVIYLPPISNLAVGRIVGVPGDRIEVKQHDAFINGKQEPPGAGQCLSTRDAAALKSRPVADFPMTSVPEGKFFILGDCRDASIDSRTFGFIERDRIQRRAGWILISPYSFGRIGQPVN